jgi:hypothetical protein
MRGDFERAAQGFDVAAQVAHVHISALHSKHHADIGIRWFNDMMGVRFAEPIDIGMHDAVSLGERL